MKSPKYFVSAPETREHNNQENITDNESELKPSAEINEEDNLTPEGNLTQEDFEALGPNDLSMDMGDDEDLKHRVYPVDFTGQDLDIPGTELDDASEDLGSEDEENNHYSIGGDNGL